MRIQGRAEKPTILHVFSAMDPGGAELRTLEALDELGAVEFNTVFVTVSGRDGKLDGLIRSRGMDVVKAPLRLSFAFRFAAIIRRYRPLVVHSHIATNSGLPLLIARVMGVERRIAHFRSDGDTHGDGILRRRRRQLMRRLIGYSSTDIVGVSPSALSGSWSAVWPADPRCTVLPNGIDVKALPVPQKRSSIRRTLGLHNCDLALIHVGRSIPEKNRLRAIDIFASLASRGDSLSSAQLIFVGEISANESELIQERARRLNLVDRIRCLGYRSDLKEILLAADLLLVTSMREGLPGVVLESLAVGTPVLSSTLPGSVWIGSLVPGVSTVDLSESDAEWVDAIEKILLGEASAMRRSTIRSGFSKGPFVIERTAAALALLWTARD